MKQLAAEPHIPTAGDRPRAAVEREEPLIVPTVDARGAPRHLAVSITGDPHGYPVFLMHGTPGSRVGLKPRYSVVYRMGIRLISFDRPGYGRSSRQPGRRVCDGASDVAAVADALDIEHFAVVGRSGGGPYALAAAALLPHRVTGLAALVSLAPADADDLDWYGGMADANVCDFSNVDEHDEATLTATLSPRAAQAFVDPSSFIHYLDKELHLAPADKRVVHDVAIRRQLEAAYREAFQQGAGGWVDDVMASRRAWGVDFSAIVAPTKLWHGRADRFSPPSHTQWLSTKIPGAEVEFADNDGHFAAIEVLPRMLAWAARQRPSVVLAGGH